jgi:schlafen family protein
MGPDERWGWKSDLPTFGRVSPRVVRLRLEQFVRDASPEQVTAWDDSIPWLQRECNELVHCDDAARTYTAILEYELPRDLRRPDVIVLEGGVIVVLELKGRESAGQAALDQVAAYARDLRAYHAACADRPVVPVLVPSRTRLGPHVVEGVHVVGPADLHAFLELLGRQMRATALSPEEFLADDAYAPLPTIVQAARDLFHHRPLPFIKRARAATEPALRAIQAIAVEAAATSTRHLVLLSGVPGSGKTLVGLQLVHAGWLDALAVPRAGGRTASPAVYLSGNGPLVAVLQDALKDAGGGGRTFVQDIKAYVRTYSRRGRSAPPEHLIVFDEAQRAHDAERVALVHKVEVDRSEPQHLIEFCSRIPGWSVLVGLIGDGQAIHQGEEGGLALWREALESSSGGAAWTVHAAATAEAPFVGTSIATRWNAALNLDTEIRFHLTPKVHEFVRAVLDRGAAEPAARLAATLHESGHRFLVTRELEAAKRYVLDRYEDASMARFGLLASSKDKALLDHGVDNSFQTTKKLRVGPWYNAPRTSPESCCRLDTVATEFSSQGLELDFAVVAWGSDLVRTGGVWSIAGSRGTRGRLHDPEAMRRNVYRVLLTRGRDGSVVFVPPAAEFDETAAFLSACGFREFAARAT